MSATNQVQTDLLPTSRCRTSLQPVGVLAVVATALGWGLNWPATKLLIALCPPLSARGVAGAAACCVLCLLAALHRETLRVARGERRRLVVGAVLNVTAWMGGTTAALRWLPAGQAVTLAYTMPVWVALLSWPILHQRPMLRQVAAILFGMAGIVVLVGPGNLSFNRAEVPGICLAIGAAVLFSLGTIWGKARPLTLGPLALTAWQVGIGSVPLLLFGFWYEAPDFAALPTFGWAALGYTALVSMGLCYVTGSLRAPGCQRRLQPPAHY